MFVDILNELIIWMRGDFSGFPMLVGLSHHEYRFLFRLWLPNVLAVVVYMQRPVIEPHRDVVLASKSKHLCRIAAELRAHTEALGELRFRLRVATKTGDREGLDLTVHGVVGVHSIATE